MLELGQNLMIYIKIMINNLLDNHFSAYYNTKKYIRSKKMDNFFTANHYEVNKKIEALYQNLNDELCNKFYPYNFRIESYMKSQEQPQILNNIGLRFLTIQPLILDNDIWKKDKNWQWSNENKTIISKICANASAKLGCEFVDINTSWDKSPLFVIRVLSNEINEINNI